MQDNTVKVEKNEVYSGHSEFQIKRLPDSEKMAHRRKVAIYNFIKRILDIFLSFFGMIFLIPLYAIVALLVIIDSKGPAFFTQTRVGKNGKTFKMYKFRSMCLDAESQLEELMHMNERDGPAFNITDDPRVTRMGRIIRRTCIDELPQLLNVFFGSMSIVGPRPPLPGEVEQYNTYQMRRLDVKPGLTCYWQVSKGENPPFAEWVQMDLDYIEKRSLWEDLKLIILTFKVILPGKGSS
ncbi:MAG: sugar transferase [Oscillospiraceae bacterium]|nr:sugar transferase [Oscillospiraceae bacterium]